VLIAGRLLDRVNTPLGIVNR